MRVSRPETRPREQSGSSDVSKGEPLRLAGVYVCNVSSDHNPLCRLYFCRFVYSFPSLSLYPLLVGRERKGISGTRFLFCIIGDLLYCTLQLSFILLSGTKTRKKPRQQLQLRLFRKTTTIHWKLLVPLYQLPLNYRFFPSPSPSITTHQGYRRLHPSPPRNRCSSSTEHHLHASAPPCHQ